MSAEINIHGNGLRMLSRIFLAVVPASQLILQVGAVYECKMDTLGVMGKVECLRFNSIYLSAIDDRLNELTDLIPEYKDWYHQRGYFLTDTVQLGYFRFQYRSEERFKQLLELEAKHIGLYLNPQPTLFTN